MSIYHKSAVFDFVTQNARPVCDVTSQITNANQLVAYYVKLRKDHQLHFRFDSCRIKTCPSNVRIKGFNMVLRQCLACNAMVSIIQKEPSKYCLR